MKETMGQRLRRLRGKQTQLEVAAAVEINNTVLSRLESDDKKKPDAAIIARLADYYGVSTDYIITGEEPDEREVAARELPGWNNDGEITEFMSWLKENVEDTFFYDFINTDEGRKEMFKQYIADQRKLWEMERKGKGK